MGLVFKKNGRPTKAEKSTLKNINSFLSSISDEDRARYDFDGERVTEPSRLNEIWEIISGSTPTKEAPPAPKEIKPDPVIEQAEEISSGQAHGDPLVVDGSPHERAGEDIVYTETGEIKNEETEQQLEIEDKAEVMEDATILDEVNEGQDMSNVNEVPTSFNPLAEPIKQRSYNSNQQADVGDIPEPDFGAAPTAQEQIAEAEERKQEQVEEMEREAAQEERQKPKPIDNIRNEAMNDLDSKDQKLAAKQLVNTVLDGYEMLHELGKRYAQYSPEKIQEKIIKEEIDPQMTIPINEQGDQVGVVEFFENFNEDAAEAMSYDPAFGEKVRPAMERVFAKKGWGMTDEQFLMVAFGKDISWKALQLFGLKKNGKAFMDTFEQLQREKIEAMSGGGYTEPPLTADTITTPPPSPQPAPTHEPQEEYYPEEPAYEAQPMDEGDGLDDLPNFETYEHEDSSEDIVPLT
jgi:hypothetical protein